MELKDRTFLVTGASGGIGRYILRHLLDAGAYLVITGRNTGSLEQCRNDLAVDLAGSVLAPLRVPLGVGDGHVARGQQPDDRHERHHLHRR